MKWNAEVPGFMAGMEHANSELKKRLKRGMDASPAEVRRITSGIRERELLTLKNVRPEFVASVTQVLETLGADVAVELEDANARALFQKLPRRR
jgi:hypothetical protein